MFELDTAINRAINERISFSEQSIAYNSENTKYFIQSLKPMGVMSNARA